MDSFRLFRLCRSPASYHLYCFFYNSISSVSFLCCCYCWCVFVSVFVLLFVVLVCVVGGICSCFMDFLFLVCSFRLCSCSRTYVWSCLMCSSTLYFLFLFLLLFPSLLIYSLILDPFSVLQFFIFLIMSYFHPLFNYLFICLLVTDDFFPVLVPMCSLVFPLLILSSLLVFFFLSSLPYSFIPLLNLFVALDIYYSIPPPPHPDQNSSRKQ